MDPRSIVLLGAGGHARSCIDVIEQQGRYTIGGLVGLPREVGMRVMGYPVLGANLDLPFLMTRFPRALIAIGQIKTPSLRMELYSLLESLGSSLPVVISPQAYVSKHARLGAGTIIMHGAVVNAGASIGRNCIVNSLALVEHDAVVGDHCHIATGAVINGNVSIGVGSFIGSGARVREGVLLGERCIVGMGQLVLVNCEAGTNLPRRKKI